jgi:3-oxoacyl-[acyl-carrier-protein] synthase-1
MAIINRPGFAQEVGHRHSSEPYRGDGLAAAVMSALSAVKTAQIKNLFSSMNGESFAAKELGVTMTRNAKKLHDDLVVEHPADAIGDSGAAVAAILVMLTSAKLNQSSIICSSAEQAKRAACVVQTVN